MPICCSDCPALYITCSLFGRCSERLCPPKGINRSKICSLQSDCFIYRDESDWEPIRDVHSTPVSQAFSKW